MSSLNKIKDFEVTPPTGAWLNIAKELDAITDFKKISESLHHWEVPPPSATWNHISNELNEFASFKKAVQRIHALEATPPPNIWNTISESLDEQEYEHLIAKKLHRIEVDAPALAWDAICEQLDDEQALSIIEKKLSTVQKNPPSYVWDHIIQELNGDSKQRPLVIPMHYAWLKYAAAACFVIMISVTGFFILKDDDHIPGNSSLTASSSKKQHSNDFELSNQAQSSTRPPQKSTVTPQQQTLAEIRTSLGNAYSVSMERNAELQNRYIVLMTQEGNVVRMSKKVSNMADCIAGEDNSCDEQISKWQKEMASSNTTSSPDNFLDILDMASADANTSSPTNL